MLNYDQSALLQLRFVIKIVWEGNCYFFEGSNAVYG